MLGPAARRVPSSKDIKKDCGIRVKWWGSVRNLAEQNYLNAGDYFFIALVSMKVKSWFNNFCVVFCSNLA